MEHLIFTIPNWIYCLVWNRKWYWDKPVVDDWPYCKVTGHNTLNGSKLTLAVRHRVKIVAGFNPTDIVHDGRLRLRMCWMPRKHRLDSDTVLREKLKLIKETWREHEEAMKEL